MVDKQIQKAIEAKLFRQHSKTGQWMIRLGCYCLDFNKDYYFDKWTKTGIKAHWINGDTKIPVLIKLKYKNFDEVVVYAEGYQFTEHVKLNKEVENEHI